MVLTGLGGLLGMFFGWMVSLAARFAFPSLPTVVPLWAAGLGIVVSVGIGLFFGIWPASKAAKLDPVEALRDHKPQSSSLPMNSISLRSKS